MYHAPKNSPFLTHTEKKIHYDKHVKDKHAQEQTPVVDLKLFQPAQRKKREPEFIYPPHIAHSSYVPNPFDMSFMDHLRENYQVVRPLVKSYNINIGDFRGKLPQMSVIEDVLPSKNVSATFTSIDNRNALNDFIRSVLFPSGDGQDMEMQYPYNAFYTGGTHNLASDVRFADLMTRMKILDLNSYYGLNPEANPFESPFGFRIYRSCYPIQHDNFGTNGTSCARDSVGVNIRIYRLEDISYLANKQKDVTVHNYDEWRDISFYLFVKNDLLKNKMSPNFAMIYGYFVALDSRIIYDTVHRQDNYYQDSGYGTYRLQAHDNINAYNGKSIVALTEAYNYNILRWATKSYRAEGNIPYMTNHGYHTPNVWYSVLFQLMSAIHCMQKKGIIINNFSLLNNVFIKDTSINGNSINYWKYKIDGIDYYVPNNGYVVLIDSNFKDLQTTEHKICGSIVGDDVTDTFVKNQTFEIFRSIFNPNTFTSTEFVNNGGNRPPDVIVNFLERIHNDASNSHDNNISHYIRKYMTMYMHNRIGTMLTDAERNNVNIGGLKNFYRGQIVVYVDTEGANRFALFINKDDLIATILTRDRNTNTALFEQEVPVHTLSEYPLSEPLRQKNTPLVNLEEDGFIELYVQ